MKNNSNEVSTGVALLLTIGVMLAIGLIISAFEPKCSMSDCDNNQKEGSRYCYLHDMSYRAYGNADYNAVYENSKKNRNNSSTSTSNYSSPESSTSSTTNKYKGTTSSKKKTNPYASYDEGYEDVYDNDDYDWDRYYSDDDYADGVDDAMDDLDW